MEDNTKNEGAIKTSRGQISKPMIIISLAVLAVIYFGFKTTSASKTMETKTPTPVAQEEAKPTPPQTNISMDEISKHAVATDCWFAVEGKVYDVTKYIASNKHGGGDAIIAGCGKDATELFNTRPMGSGTPHSDKARSFLPNFQIGLLN